MDLVCFSHFIQNDKATSVDFCSFFLSFFLSFSRSVFFLCIYSSRASSYWQSMSTRFPAHKHTQSSRKRRKKKGETVRKNMGGRSSVVFVVVAPPSFLISRVNFHCVQQKRIRERTKPSIDGWMVRCTDRGNLYLLRNLHIVRNKKNERREGEEERKRVPKS